MVQNISGDKYNEIRKMTLFCFSKYFKKFGYLKDDLIQEGIINVLKHIDNFDESKATYSTFVLKYARYGMLTYIDSIYKTGVGRRYFKFDYTLLSLDADLNTSSDNYTLSDIIVDENSEKKFDVFLNKDCLKQCIENALIKCCSFKKNISLDYALHQAKGFVKKRKNDIKNKKYKILCDYLKTLNISETAKNFGVSRQFVSLCKKDFEKYLKHELIENGFYN